MMQSEDFSVASSALFTKERPEREPYCYAISTNDTTTAVQPAVLRCGPLRLLIVLWRNRGEQCRASATRFIYHYTRNK